MSRRFLLERGLVLAYTSAPPVFSSDMSEGVMIFGGIEELRAKIAELKETYPAVAGGKKQERVFFVLTTCPAGIIGDNIGRVMDLEDENTKIVPIKTDGNITGDFMQGILFAYFEIARALIDRSAVPEENTVNIVAEKPETYAVYASFAAVKEILDSFGIRVNCHFICESSVEEIRGFRRGKLNLLAWDDYLGRGIREFLEKEYSAEFLDEPFPVGFAAAARYTRTIGRRFGKSEAETGAVIDRFERKYRAEIAEIRPALEGKRVMIVTVTQNIDWVLRTILDAGMSIAFVGIMDYSQESTFTTELGASIQELALSYDMRNSPADLQRVKPDLFLTPFPGAPVPEGVFQDSLTYSPQAGFSSGLVLARRWAEIFNMNLDEGWRRDESLYRKYYA
jgi:nitrogenase molybdenum-iron protein alpha/beta subunit